MPVNLDIPRRTDAQLLTAKSGLVSPIGVDTDGNLRYNFAGGLVRLLTDASRGQKWYVDHYYGSDTAYNGKGPSTAFATISKAVSEASPFDTIYVSWGSYDETVTIPRTLPAIAIVGVANRGGVAIAPSTENAGALVCHADGVTIMNIGLEGDGTGSSLVLSGSRFRAFGCKMEGGTNQVLIAPGTAAQVDDDETHGTAGDCIFEDCEFCWGTHGVNVGSSTYGSTTQLLIRGCRFHNLTGTLVDETDTGGSGAGRNIWIIGNVFDALEDGTAPDALIDLNTTNTTGLVAQNVFATTVHAASEIALASGVLYVGNFAQAEGPATGGGTAGRPD